MKKVSVICIDCDSVYIDLMLGRQTYTNLEVVEAATGKDFYQDIVDYCESTDSDYICFLENRQLIGNHKINNMVAYAERTKDAEVVLCLRSHCEEDGMLVGYPDKDCKDMFENRIFEGDQMLLASVRDGKNLFGNLTSVMFRREKAELCMERLKQYKVDGNPQMQKTFLLFEILAKRSAGLLMEMHVMSFVSNFDARGFKAQEKVFYEEFQTFARLHGWRIKDNISGINKVHGELIQEIAVEDMGLRKEITFFATDKGEYYNLLPIAREAEKRGYRVRHTDDLDEKAEIGIYCQHFGKPQNAKFSVVLLHDMAQGYSRRPNIWAVENWCVYDMGILPGLRWKECWERSAFDYHAYPRCGAYMMGYPKSQEVFSEELENRVRELKDDMNLKYDISVLYAPSWENDGKEDDFVQALSSLPVNLLVKQASWSENFYWVTKNNEEMRRLHEGKYDNLYYIESEESIMVALKMCDLIVSDESSVIIEGAMFGKPALVVEDWLIPDVDPSRFANCPFEDVYKCTKASLRDTVEGLLAEGLSNLNVAKRAGDFFANKEHVNRDIMDAIEYFTTGRGNKEFMKWKMSCRYMPRNMWS